MNQARNNLAGLTSDGEPQVRWSAWFSGDSCGKPLLKGGHHEAQLSPRGQTELPRAIGMDAVVTMYDRSGGAMPSASPLNDQAQRQTRELTMNNNNTTTSEPQGLGAVRCSDWLGRVLVACEYSGRVRDAFAALGWDAWSCDILPTDAPGKHHTGDVRELLTQQWDIMIAFPPCTYLCSSGMHWTVRGKRDPQLTEDALEFVRTLLGANVPHIALENPVGAISTRIRKPDCVIHPWQFGTPESKTTCLWLKNLPPLKPTEICQKPASGRWENQTPSGQNKLGPSKDRWKERSKTYPGIASAMAAQWSAFVLDSRTTAPPAARTAGSLQQVVGPPNKYDQAFFRWFRNRGWRILAGLGEIAVWSHDDICCPFKVTTGMIERLENAGMLKQWIPDNCGIWDRWYITNDRWPNGGS